MRYWVFGRVAWVPNDAMVCDYLAAQMTPSVMECICLITLSISAYRRSAIVLINYNLRLATGCGTPSGSVMSAREHTEFPTDRHA